LQASFNEEAAMKNKINGLSITLSPSERFGRAGKVERIFCLLHLKTLYLFIVCLLLFSCAQVVSPGGGPKDSDPPRVVKYAPDSAALHFKGKSFNITFNEYVQLKDISGQLIVSPLLKKQPEVKVKNKTLTVTFEDTLRENTTYTFNFGNAVRDITEDNYTDGFRYIFSTGDFLDSISLKGKVDYAFDHKTDKGILVMLYDELYDSLPYKKPPTYFAKTKENGTFEISNIKAGKYKVVALKDGNANYMYDSDEESIGFLNEPIDLQKNDTLSISLFKEEPKKLFLKKHKVEGYGHLLFVFNKPVEEIDIQSLYTTYKKEWYIKEYSEKRDSLHLWLSDAGDPDSISIVLSEKDKVIDTLFFNLIKKEKALNPKGGRGEKLNLKATANVKKGQQFDLNKPITLEFNHPIKTWKRDSVKLIGDSSGIINVLSPDNRNLKLFNHILADGYSTADGNLHTGWITGYELKLKGVKKYLLFIPPGSFTDIFDLQNDTIKIDFTTREEKYYGTLKLKLSLPELKEELTLQLLGEKGEVIHEDFIAAGEKNKTFDYNYLDPRKYKFKIIYDTNKNGKWDAGNYLEHQQAEKVIYSKDVVEIRSNWDKEVEWKVIE